MASLEWLREHRELQYLRAAMWECQPGTRAGHRRRRRYADVRWRKLRAVNPRFRGEPGRTGPSVHRPSTHDQELN